MPKVASRQVEHQGTEEDEESYNNDQIVVVDLLVAEIAISAPQLLSPVQCVQGVDADAVNVRLGREVLFVETVEDVVLVAARCTGSSWVTLISRVRIVAETDLHLGRKFLKIRCFLPQSAVLVQRLGIARVTVSFGPESMLSPNIGPGASQDL